MIAFLELHPDGVTNKDFPSFINLFRDELSKTPQTLLPLIANYLISSNSKQATLTVLTRIKGILNNTSHISDFKSLCDKNLMQSFYIRKDSNITELNFESGYNYMFLFDKSSLFTNHELDFVQLFSILSTNVQSMKIESISTATKLLENYLDFQQKPTVINFQSNTKLADQFHFDQTTFSAIASICIDLINSQTNFDIICSLIRSLTHCISNLFNDEDLEKLFSPKNSPNTFLLYTFLNNSIPYHCFLLILSNLIKKFPHKSNLLLDLLETILSDESAPILKCFGYTALTRISSVVTDLPTFSKHVITSLLRDYDSQNPILPSLLDNLYKTLLKRSKQLKVVDQINKILFDSIQSLSWHSMVKLMIVPDIICSFPSLFDELIGLAQDPSDYGFVTRCIKSISKSSIKSSEDLLQAIVNDTLKSSIYNNLRIVRPLLEPFYATRPEMIPKAFKMFNEIVHDNEINSKEKLLSIWLRFESLLTLTRSLWPMDLFDLNNDLNFAVHSGNWDLRCSSLRVFNKCFNTDPIPLDFILNLKIVIFTDSPKNIFFIEDAFSNFIELLNPKRKRDEVKKEEDRMKEIETILLSLLDIITDHMSSAFTSSHRQFMLVLIESIWKKFPSLYSQKHIDAVSSILFDPSLSLRYLCLEKMKMWSKEDPNKIFATSNMPHELLNKKNNVETNIEQNDSLLVSLIQGICNNNFESLKELETLVADFKSKNIFSQQTLQVQIEKYFDFFLETKNVGISYRSQSLFVILSNLLDKTILNTKRKAWESRLLSILRDFDMESMRRSASLPDVTLALLRLQPPEITTDDTSKHLEIITALIELLRRTDNETEAVNSLNVIRAVLKDKITSKIEDYLYPIIFNSIFETSMKFTGFDFVAASNLCFASTFHKLFKRSDTTLNIRQFFHKLPKAKEMVINGLKSPIVHANYLALTVLTAFRKTNGDDKTIIEFVVPFISHKSSRLRRTAAIGLVSITPKSELHFLYQQAIYYLSISRFVSKSNYESNGYFNITEINCNTFHGLLMLIDEILKKTSIEIEFPVINLQIVPPMTIEDICSIYSKLNIVDRLNSQSIQKFGSLYCDQVSLILYRGKIESNELKILNDSVLVSLLTKLQRNCSIVTNLDQFILNRLKQELISPLIFTLSINYFYSIYQTDQNLLKTIGFNPSDYLNAKTPKDSIAPLVLMLPEDENTIQQYSPLFIDIAFSKDDNDTPAKIAVSSKLSSILKFSFYGKIVSLLLLIDDIPIVRTKASEIVSSFLKIQFMSEVELFEILIKDLSQFHLNAMFLRWVKIIEFKIKTDPKGESVTTLVDEFFVLQKIAEVLKVPVDFTRFRYLPIDQARTEAIESFKLFDVEAYNY